MDTHDTAEPTKPFLRPTVISVTVLVMMLAVTLAIALDASSGIDDHSQIPVTSTPATAVEAP